MSKFIGRVPFHVYFRNTSGPYILPGYQTSLQKVATIQIDGGPVRNFTEADAIVPEFIAGAVAKVEYFGDDGSNNRIEVSLRGFARAYAKLTQLVQRLEAPR